MISDKLLKRGICLFGDKQDFCEWLNKDVKALGNKKPTTPAPNATINVAFIAILFYLGRLVAYAPIFLTADQLSCQIP